MITSTIIVYKGTEHVNDETIVNSFTKTSRRVKDLISFCKMLIATERQDKSARITFWNKSHNLMIYDVQWDKYKENLIVKRDRI